jgi:hypothetical protein
MGEVRREREPLLSGWVIQGSETGAVLVVAPSELHVVQDDPAVGGEQLGQRGQPGKQVRLVDRAQPARRIGAGRLRY